MRTAATLALCLAAFPILSGCARSDRKDTALIVANLTGQPITVQYAQDPANARTTPMLLEQRVLPENSIRFEGTEGDRVTVNAGTGAPVVVEYARRSQVLLVDGDGSAVTFDLRRGQVDPTRNPPQ